MTDPRAASSAGRFEVRTTSDSHFGWVRTRLSLERTMISWLRTATALIGFVLRGARPGALDSCCVLRLNCGSKGTDFSAPVII
jgi:Domain of unknown function (DUF202)